MSTQILEPWDLFVFAAWQMAPTTWNYKVVEIHAIKFRPHVHVMNVIHCFYNYDRIVKNFFSKFWRLLEHLRLLRSLLIVFGTKFQKSVSHKIFFHNYNVLIFVIRSIFNNRHKHMWQLSNSRVVTCIKSDIKFKNCPLYYV